MGLPGAASWEPRKAQHGTTHARGVWPSHGAEPSESILSAPMAFLTPSAHCSPHSYPFSSPTSVSLMSLSPLLPPNSSQADSQFSASLPGAGKPETAQVQTWTFAIAQPRQPPAVSKPCRTFPVPHCLPDLRQEIPSLGLRSGLATERPDQGWGCHLCGCLALT